MELVPELPEVETIRRGLEPGLLARSIIRAWGHDSPKFASAPQAVGMSVTAVSRRGKYLLINLTDPDGNPFELIVHLGMTGQLRLVPAPGTDDTHVRARWWLSAPDRDPVEETLVLELRDVRRFGRVAVVEAGEYATLSGLSKLGPEPLDASFDGPTLKARITRRSGPIKAVLLDQSVVAGIGNIYADEALFEAQVHPRYPANQLSGDQCQALVTAVRNQLNAGLADGGTTLRDYRQADGGSGAHQNHLMAYGRAGERCPRCTTTMVFETIGSRTSTFCPRCQTAS